MSGSLAAGVLDTSVFIAAETGRQLDTSLIPDQVATTVITLAELNVGVLAASNSDIRAQRLATLEGRCRHGNAAGGRGGSTNVGTAPR